jgi:hypothetical protein
MKDKGGIICAVNIKQGIEMVFAPGWSISHEVGVPACRCRRSDTLTGTETIGILLMEKVCVERVMMRIWKRQGPFI